MNLLPIHKRKPLTGLQAAQVFRDANGVCWVCKEKIFGPWRDEHKRPLALGGSNELSNRAPVHYACAKEKDVTDKASIAKAKRIEAKRIGYVVPKQKINSRGFRQQPSNVKQLHEDFADV